MLARTNEKGIRMKLHCWELLGKASNGDIFRCNECGMLAFNCRGPEGLGPHEGVLYTVKNGMVYVTDNVPNCSVEQMKRALG